MPYMATSLHKWDCTWEVVYSPDSYVSGGRQELTIHIAFVIMLDFTCIYTCMGRCMYMYIYKGRCMYPCCICAML